MNSRTIKSLKRSFSNRRDTSSTTKSGDRSRAELRRKSPRVGWRLWVVPACLLTLAGCGGNASAGKPPTATVVKPPTSTAVPALPTNTPFVQAATPVLAQTATATTTPTAVHIRRARPTFTATSAPPTAAPTATPAAATGPVQLDFVSVSPLSVAAAGTLSFSARTSGGVRRVEMYLGSGLPNAPAPLTFELSESAPGRWSAQGLAPQTAGTYHFTVGLFSASGRRFLEDNDGWNVTVRATSGGTTTEQGGGSAPALFADVPLAPPFSYGNPVQAVFNANGSVVNGAEIVSNTRTDVPASTVATFYSIHFPRAGWSTAGVTLPAGATSFTLSATSGSRVCIVQFAAGTVHIFYGTT